MRPDHELIADVGKGWKRYQTASKILGNGFLVWTLVYVVVFLSTNEVRLDNQRIYFDGDTGLMVRFAISIVTWFAAFLPTYAFSQGWPMQWLTMPLIVAANGILVGITVPSMKWTLVVTVLLALTVVIAWIWIAPLFRRKGLFTFIRRLARLHYAHRQGAHQVVAIEGHGPWALQLKPVPTRHATPCFSTVQVNTPPALAPGDFVAINHNRQVEFSGRISR